MSFYSNCLLVALWEKLMNWDNELRCGFDITSSAPFWGFRVWWREGLYSYHFRSDEKVTLWNCFWHKGKVRRILNKVGQ